MKNTIIGRPVPDNITKRRKLGVDKSQMIQNIDRHVRMCGWVGVAIAPGSSGRDVLV